MKCRFDGLPVDTTILDLGPQPLANALATSQKQALEATRYPLEILFNPRNGLIQTSINLDPTEVFHKDYPYYSSTSSLWLSHAYDFVKEAIYRFGLTSSSHVLEIGSNDGYLLQHFVQSGVPCWGVEPVEKLAEVSRAKGVPAINEFFSQSSAERIRLQHGEFDLIVANNVLAHIPDLRGTLNGIRVLLKPQGIAVVEVPDVVQMIQDGCFDAVYHEHVFHFSFSALVRCAHACDLAVVDVEKMSTHGGSLRLYLSHLRHQEIGTYKTVEALCAEERSTGVAEFAFLSTIQQRAEHVRGNIRNFIIPRVERGESVAAYPASAKGTLFLNYCGLDHRYVTTAADKASAKQGRFIPGVGTSIIDIPSMLATSPDYIVILARNILSELISEIRSNSSWRGSVIVPYPDLKIIGPTDEVP